MTGCPALYLASLVKIKVSSSNLPSSPGEEAPGPGEKHAVTRPSQGPGTVGRSPFPKLFVPLSHRLPLQNEAWAASLPHQGQRKTSPSLKTLKKSSDRARTLRVKRERTPARPSAMELRWPSCLPQVQRWPPPTL